MKQFTKVSGRFGAPMGRQPIFDNPDATVTVFKVNMVDGDYDDGGAYWGGPPNDPLYCARGDGFLDFTRAKNQIEAEVHLQDQNCQINIVRDDNEIVNSFVEGYLICAAWADAPEGSNARFSKRAKEQALVDCQDFIATCRELFFEALEWRDAEHLGHDFWLSRCGHGTGFWDRAELEVDGIGDDLHAKAEVFRGVSLYAERGWLNFDIG